MADFTQYVAGFLFNEQKTRVVLITKNRPDYLAGMLNGVGGKVEHGESLFDAMSREFHEETGLVVYDWNIYASIDDPNYTVHFFHKTVCGSVLDEAQTMTDEHVGVYAVDNLPDNVMYNLRWLIPLALDVTIKNQSVHIS